MSKCLNAEEFFEEAIVVMRETIEALDKEIDLKDITINFSTVKKGISHEQIIKQME